jgi:translocator protein
MKMDSYTDYSQLIKPTWSPPGWLFGPVWTVLYILIAISFGRVFINASQGKLPFIIALPFILNLIFNFAFTPLQFGLKNLLLASIDILLVLMTLLWAMLAIYPFFNWVTYIQIPYLIWVSFASVLQLTITWLNK